MGKGFSLAAILNAFDLPLHLWYKLHIGGMEIDTVWPDFKKALK